MIKGKLKNSEHALRRKRINSGVRDGHAMEGGKKHLPLCDISSGSYFDFDTQGTIIGTYCKVYYKRNIELDFDFLLVQLQ